MVLGGRWYQLALRPEAAAEAAQSVDPVARLPVTLLAKYVIEPVFGVSDPRRDKRIDFVGGDGGLGDLERLVTSGEVAVAFTVFSDADARPHGGRRRRRHAAEIDLVRTKAR
jgi:uncharacterized protein (DUF1015 family)